MVAIQTKYLGPTNYRPSRVKATANKKSITLSYSELESLSGNTGRQIVVFAQAAKELLKKRFFQASEGLTLVSGCLDNGNYVFCFDNSEKFEI